MLSVHLSLHHQTRTIVLEAAYHAWTPWNGRWSARSLISGGTSALGGERSLVAGHTNDGTAPKSAIHSVLDRKRLERTVLRRRWSSRGRADARGTG